MSSLHLRVITPKKIVFEEEVTSVNVPTAEGELTILPQHVRLFALLKQGIVTIRNKQKEESLAIGGGYLETDGKELTLLVSRAYGQDEINEEQIERAIKEAKEILAKSKDQKEIIDATTLLRRSTLDLKLIRR